MSDQRCDDPKCEGCNPGPRYETVDAPRGPLTKNQRKADPVAVFIDMAFEAGKPEPSLSRVVADAVNCVQVCTCVPDPTCAVHGKPPESKVTTTHHRDGGTTWVLTGKSDSIARYFAPLIYFGTNPRSDAEWKREAFRNQADGAFGDGAIQ